MLHVFDAATGTPHYMQRRLPKPYNFKASPLVVNDRVYLATEEGDVVVVSARRRHRRLFVLLIRPEWRRLAPSHPAPGGDPRREVGDDESTEAVTRRCVRGNARVRPRVS